MLLEKGKSRTIFNILGYTYTAFLTVYCLIPFLLILSGSFTDETSIFVDGYRLIPKKFSLAAYEQIFRDASRVFRAYGITVLVTTVGASLGLFIIAMTGYVLQRKDFRYRNTFSFMIYFTSIFSGGLIPWYIMIVKYLHLKDKLVVLILPALMNAWLIILMKNFMKSIPDSISESAKIDGAGDFTIFLRLIFPLSKPGLATIGLFLALWYWNDWFLAALYINSQKQYPLQFFLYSILTNAEFLRTATAGQVSSITFKVPTESLKLAMAIVVTGPIVFLYPYVQRFFIKGLTVGAVKG